MCASFLDIEGTYDKVKRYMVYNWSDEDFTQKFGEDSAYNGNNVVVVNPAYSLTIKAGEMRQLGQFEAYVITKHLVNREMMKESAKVKDDKARERLEMAMNNEMARKPYEDKTIQEAEFGKESTFMTGLREQIREEELLKIKSEKSGKKEETKKNVNDTAEFAGV